MEIRKIAVIGAGAIGSFFLNGWRDNKDVEVWAVASGERKERLEKTGLTINKEQVFFEVKTPERSAGADLLIICVKYGNLPEVLDEIEKIIDEHTIVMCPMNGINTEDIIAERIGKKHIIHSMMVISAERNGNSIIYNGGADCCVHYGRAEGFGSLPCEGGYDEELEAVKAVFAAGGPKNKFHDNIITIIWNKFALNISTNIAQAIVGCNYGAYKDSPYMHEASNRLCDEVLAVAKAKGVECTYDNERAFKTVKTDDCARFSTLQDLMAGRRTEVDMFCGEVVRLGRELNVQTPYNQFALLLIKALEEKNDGLIC